MTLDPNLSKLQTDLAWAQGFMANINADLNAYIASLAPPPPPPAPVALWTGTIPKVNGLPDPKPWSMGMWLVNQQQVTVVDDPIDASRGKMLKFSVNDNETAEVSNTGGSYDGGNPRADLQGPQIFKPGDDLYFSIDFIIPDAAIAQIAAGNPWFQIWEIYGHPGGGSPPIGLGLTKSGSGAAVKIGRGKTHGYDTPWQRQLDGQRHKIVIHETGATDGTGLVELWFDGLKQMFADGTQALHQATLEPGVNWDGHTPNWVVVNQYRQKGAIPGTVTTYHGEAKIGSTYASVA